MAFVDLSVDYRLATSSRVALHRLRDPMSCPVQQRASSQVPFTFLAFPKTGTLPMYQIRNPASGPTSFLPKCLNPLSQPTEQPHCCAITMQSANHLQKTLKSNTPAFGAWQMLPGPTLPRTICRASPSISWLLIDLEHGNLHDDNMHELVAAAASCGVSPVVRVADAQHWMIKRALDAGAHGILVPMIESVDDARRVVECAKFPPNGKRGFESLLAVDKFRSHVYDPPTGGVSVHEPTGAEYLAQANDALVIGVQIETRGALEDVEAIAAVNGIDVLFIGPFDLAVNIGFPITGPGEENYAPELRDAIQRVYEAGRRYGKAVGIYCETGAQARSYARRGFGMVSVVTDLVGLGMLVKREFGVAAGVE
ncbi:HpcH/HpaI aldolase family protein [Aspergillus mulundensis]|uniref:HpcH/HpaI aldolase/citrate lyase domain-containing protein n=1 Tax=Aspergillus mulundensis TaxID=1810919 RepID=A0A3D8SL95_9EURO|nr:Uncharacterized protein DSM5745_03674 [Aspergillus mulundensis]RDW87032.1 Uncharacterized protein DSM5745_03674 [Aspergillus mulundensis]